MVMLENDNLITQSSACRSMGSAEKGIILFHLPVNIIILSQRMNKYFKRIAECAAASELAI